MSRCDNVFAELPHQMSAGHNPPPQTLRSFLPVHNLGPRRAVTLIEKEQSQRERSGERKPS